MRGLVLDEDRQGTEPDSAQDAAVIGHEDDADPRDEEEDRSSHIPLAAPPLDLPDAEQASGRQQTVVPAQDAPPGRLPAPLGSS